MEIFLNKIATICGFRDLIQFQKIRISTLLLFGKYDWKNILTKQKKTAQNFSNVTGRKKYEEELDEDLNYRNEVVLEKERT